MKKFVAFLLIIMMLFALVACGGDDAQPEQKKDEAAQTEEQKDEAKPEATEEVKDKEETKKAEDTEDAAETRYVLTAILTDDEGIESGMVEDFEAQGIDLKENYIVMAPDGKGEMVLFGEQAPDFSWDEQAIYADGDPAVYMIKGNDLLLNIGDGEIMIYTLDGEQSSITPDDFEVLASYFN